MFKRAEEKVVRYAEADLAPWGITEALLGKKNGQNPQRDIVVVEISLYHLNVLFCLSRIGPNRYSGRSVQELWWIHLSW